jgi:putative intracellular protease/amidase
MSSAPSFASAATNAASSRKRILIVVTNEAFIPSNREHQSIQQSEQQNFAFLESPQMQPNVSNKNYTGVNVYELAQIWQVIRQQMNIPVDFASPRGGPTAADPMSVEKMRKDEKLRQRVSEDREFIECMGHTYPLDWIKPEDYSCIIIPGCHGSMFDLPECRQLENIIMKVYEKHGYICTIGHGAAALINVKKPNSNEFLVANRKITCFSNREEKEMSMDRMLPYMIEDRLKERGARVEVAEPNKTKVIVDERIITAQNSQSVQDFVKEITKNIKETAAMN